MYVISSRKGKKKVPVIYFVRHINNKSFKQFPLEAKNYHRGEMATRQIELKYIRVQGEKCIYVVYNLINFFRAIFSVKKKGIYFRE